MNATFARVGMFGGAFDPPHRAHEALARAALEQLRLDVLYLFPTGRAWHKARHLTGGEHRLAMARLAFEGIERVRVDERELERSGPTYTLDTLRELRAEHPQAELFLLIGEDQAASFSTWRGWPEIAQLATLAVAQRGGPDAGGIDRLRALPGVRVQPLRTPPMPESATEIRLKLTMGQDITELVAPGVARYIAQHHLYRTA